MPAKAIAKLEFMVSDSEVSKSTNYLSYLFCDDEQASTWSVDVPCASNKATRCLYKNSLDRDRERERERARARESERERFMKQP